MRYVRHLPRVSRLHSSLTVATSSAPGVSWSNIDYILTPLEGLDLRVHFVVAVLGREASRGSLLESGGGVSGVSGRSHLHQAPLESGGGVSGVSGHSHLHQGSRIYKRCP